jgi:hypothetical protein
LPDLNYLFMSWAVVMTLRVQARWTINYIYHGLLPDVLHHARNVADLILHHWRHRRGWRGAAAPDGKWRERETRNGDLPTKISFHTALL